MAKLTYYERKAVKNSIFLPEGFSTLSKKQKQLHLNGRCCGCGGETPVELEHDGDYDGRVIGINYAVLCDGCSEATGVYLTKDGWKNSVDLEDHSQEEGNDDLPF